MRLALTLLLVIPAFAGAQTPRAFRLPIQHADPYAVKALMEGRPITAPEISTILGVTGQTGMAAAATAANLAMGGTFFVNPTDNSLWWIPAKGA